MYPQAYLEECKYKLRKRRVVNFIDSEIIDMIVIVMMIMILIMKIIFQISDSYVKLKNIVPIKDINSILKINKKWLIKTSGPF